MCMQQTQMYMCSTLVEGSYQTVLHSIQLALLSYYAQKVTMPASVPGTLPVEMHGN